MRDNEKCNISRAPSPRLKQYSVLNTKCIGVIDPGSSERHGWINRYQLSFGKDKMIELPGETKSYLVTCVEFTHLR